LWPLYWRSGLKMKMRDARCEMRELRSTLLSVHARLVVQVDREKVRHSGGLFRQDPGNSTCHTCEGGHYCSACVGDKTHRQNTMGWSDLQCLVEGIEVGQGVHSTVLSLRRSFRCTASHETSKCGDPPECTCSYEDGHGHRINVFPKPRKQVVVRLWNRWK
jgi:hypothetical protein